MLLTKLILKKIKSQAMSLSKMNQSTKYVSLGLWKSKKEQVLQKWNKVGCKITVRNHKLDNNQASRRRTKS